MNLDRTAALSFETGPASTLSPDAALVVFTCGVLLIYLELNRPGTILPGSCGLLLVLLAIAALRAFPPDSVGLVLLLGASCLLLFSVRRKLPIVLEAIALLALICGFYRIGRTPGAKLPYFHLALAAICGLLIGASSLSLSRVARRARRNKGLD